MAAACLLACVGMVTGFFLILGLKPSEFSDGLSAFLLREPGTLRSEVNRLAGRKKPGLLKRELIKAQDALVMTGRGERFPLVFAAALALFAAGASVAILAGNLFLAPVLACGFLFVPFWYVCLTEGHYKRDVAAELETALSIITTAYLRNEDFLRAVEENLRYLNPPVKEAFRDFAARVRMVDPDMEEALKILRQRVRNDVFMEWCDAVAACQYDRGLKAVLPPIVDRMSDMRIVNGELEILMTEPRKEFITMVFLVLGNVPLMYFLNRGWYEALMFTPLGQAVLAAVAVLVFVCAALVIRLTKPLEYGR